MKLISVVIVSYEGRKHFNRILDSLAKQHYANMEVVISDDCSRDTCDDIIESYQDRLNIVRTSTKTHSGNPADTRQAGLKIASGEWITFADQDDAFYLGVMSKVATYIRKNPEIDVFRTEFDEVEPVTEKVFRHHKEVYGWTHGMFIRRSWMKEHNIQYKAGLKSHEDIYLSTLIACELNNSGKQQGYCPVCTYKWTAWNESLSHKEDRLFIDNHLKEYIEATGDVYIEDYLKNGSKEFSVFHSIGVVLYCYFYHMGCIFRDVKGFVKENTQYIADYITKVKKTFEMSNDELLLYCAKDKGTYFWNTMELAMVATGPYIPCLTLEQYLFMTAPEGKEAET